MLLTCATICRALPGDEASDDDADAGSEPDLLQTALRRVRRAVGPSGLHACSASAVMPFIAVVIAA